MGLGASPTHIVVRGAVDYRSVRCDWRGVARTLSQREHQIRYWLGIGDAEAMPTPGKIEERFMEYVNGMSPKHRPTWRANVTALSRGGLSTDTLFLGCYATYEVYEYLLGGGRGKITVSYEGVGESRSYNLYTQAHAAGAFSDDLFLVKTSINLNGMKRPATPSGGFAT